MLRNSPAPAGRTRHPHTQRAAVVQSFRAALTATVEELVPVLEQRNIAVTGDVVYKCAFTLFTAWRDSGAR